MARQKLLINWSFERNGVTKFVICLSKLHKRFSIMNERKHSLMLLSVQPLSWQQHVTWRNTSSGRAFTPQSLLRTYYGDNQCAELCDEQPNHPSNQTNSPRFLEPEDSLDLSMQIYLFKINFNIISHWRLSLPNGSIFAQDHSTAAAANWNLPVHAKQDSPSRDGIQFGSRRDFCKQKLIVTDTYTFYFSNKQLYYHRINNNIIYAYIYIYLKKWVPGIPLGVKAASACGWRPTTLVVPNVKKSEALTYPDPLGPSRRPVVGETFTFIYI